MRSRTLPLTRFFVRLARAAVHVRVARRATPAAALGVALTAWCFAPVARGDVAKMSDASAVCPGGGVIDGHLGAPVCVTARENGSGDRARAASATSVMVEVDALTFENGDVPTAEAAVQRMKHVVAQCAGERPSEARAALSAAETGHAPLAHAERRSPERARVGREHHRRRAHHGAADVSRADGERAAGESIDPAYAQVHVLEPLPPVSSSDAQGAWAGANASEHGPSLKSVTTAPGAANLSTNGGSTTDGDMPGRAHKSEAASRVANDPPSTARLRSAQGSVRVTFLVRAPGRAEGVDVAQSSAVSGALLRCVTTSLTGRVIGTPTSDAVGVSVTFRLRRVARKQNQ